MCQLEKLQFCLYFGRFEVNHWCISEIKKDRELTPVELWWWFQQCYSCFLPQIHTVICMEDSQPLYCLKCLWIHNYSISRTVFDELMSRWLSVDQKNMLFRSISHQFLLEWSQWLQQWHERTSIFIWNHSALALRDGFCWEIWPFVCEEFSQKLCWGNSEDL